jgi:pyruvate dehydrogenase E1 component beta subunit
MSVTMAKALNTALRDALAEDDRVLVMGEDVGRLGGVFRVTDGLTAEFGEERCFDTPLAEAGIVGTAVGMAMYGLVPVVEMQFDAFAYPAFEQITSHVAKTRNRTRGRLNLPYYVHTPGLTVVAPATVDDAYSLLRASIAAPDPVVFLEPKRLYWREAEVDLPVRTPPPGRALVRRAGRHATLIAYGPTVPTALEAADAAAEDGWDLEVVDLRSLVPLDDATLTESVRRTGRAIVVHEAPGFAGFGAELAARVTERCFHHLEAPVLRVTGFDTPYPPPKLEHRYLPDVDRILDAVDRLQWEATS